MAPIECDPWTGVGRSTRSLRRASIRCSTTRPAGGCSLNHTYGSLTYMRLLSAQVRFSHADKDTFRDAWVPNPYDPLQKVKLLHENLFEYDTTSYDDEAQNVAEREEEYVTCVTSCVTVCVRVIRGDGADSAVCARAADLTTPPVVARPGSVPPLGRLRPATAAHPVIGPLLLRAFVRLAAVSSRVCRLTIVGRLLFYLTKTEHKSVHHLLPIFLHPVSLELTTPFLATDYTRPMPL